MNDVRIRPLIATDRPWVAAFLTAEWGTAAQAVRGTLFYPQDLPGFIATRAAQPVGLATYRQLAPDTVEMATLNSLQSGLGIGTMLIRAVANAAKVLGASSLVVVTTNDNLQALRFYQRRGFVLSDVRIGAVNLARCALKPEIPLLGDDDIPIRDEIELTLTLQKTGAT